jgi:tetratricopeptide (TPR) repeat protein
LRRALIFGLALCGAAVAQDTPAEKLIEAGHWKRARAIVEPRLREAPDDPLANFLTSQIRAAFGDRESPMTFAEKAVSLDGRTAKYHRQIAEVSGIAAQHAGVFTQLGLARRFRKEIDTALALDPHDVQALRDLLEFYLLAPGIAGGDVRKAEVTAGRVSAIDAAQGDLAKARIASFRKQYGEAEALLRHAVESAPTNYKVRLALAQFHIDPLHSNWDGAEEQAKAAARLDPGRTDAYSVLAAVYAQRSDWGKLDALLAEAAAAVPDDLTPYYRAAERLLSSHQDLSRAEGCLRTYLSQPPEGNAPTAAEANSKLHSVHVPSN